MKLSNKGFAFSTMLYGVLALIIVVLMLIFNVLKSSSDESYYYSSVVEETLNKCVTEEIALENCYSSGSTNCNPTSYYACIGINNNVTVGTNLSALLKEKGVSDGLSNGLYKENDSERLIYRGTSNVNNYIQYSGGLWRIIAIEEGGAIKIAYTGYSNILKWDANGENEWSSSSLNNELSNTFYSSLQNTSIIDKRPWSTGRIYDEAITLIDIIEQEDNVKYNPSSGNYGYISLPNASDYIKASLNSACTSDILNNDSCNSWLSAYGSWLVNSSFSSEGDNMAYYFESNNKLNKKSVDEEYNVIPVLYLKSSVKTIGGTGSLNNPFLLER